MIDFCLSAIHQPEIRAQALKDITTVFASQGDFKLALKFSDGIEDTYVFNQTQAIIVLSYAKNKQFESAYRLSESIEVDHFKSLSMSYIAVELTRFNQLDKALEVVDSFESEPLQQSTYADMTEVLAKNSQFEDALLVASKITDKAKSDALIINAAGYFGDRKDYLHPTLLINQISDPDLKSAATSAFLIQFAPHGSMDKVLSMASTIGDKTMRDTTLSKIAESIISTAKIADALSCLKRIESNPFRAETALTLAQKVANPLHAEFANPFLDIAEPLISKYLNGIEKAQAYTKMAAIYAELNLPTLSATALGNATKLLALLPPSKEKDNEIKALFAAHLIADKPAEALELLTFLSDPEDWVSLYLQIPLASNPIDEKRLKKQIQSSLGQLKKK